MPIAATQESSGATNVIGFSLAFVKWDIFLKDLTPRVIWLEVIYRLFLFKSKFPEKSFEIMWGELKLLKKSERNAKSAFKWHDYYLNLISLKTA